jgi:hypothetical protein
MIRTARATPKSSRRSPKDIAAAVQEKLDATPERLARAREAGETPVRDAERLRRILDPFDTMRANRLLAPHDQKLNDIRWLIGESLRRTHQRARLDALRAVAPDRLGSTGFGPRPGLPQSEAALHARDKLRNAEGSGRPRRVADRHPHHHRRSRSARLPGLRPRTRHPVARGRRCHRPPAGRARHARRPHGGNERPRPMSPDV